MTQKKAIKDAKTQFDKQVQEELHALEINNDAAQELETMRTMELFINHPIDDESNMEEENDELTQAKLDKLTASFSN
jgi:hypothetical protein